MQISPLSRMLCLFSAAMLCLSLPACTNKPAPKPRKQVVRPVKPKETYQADAYVLHLSLARASLMEHAPDDAQPHVAVLQAYSEQKKLKKRRQPVAVLSFKLKGQEEMQQLLAPLSLASEEFPSVLQVMDRIESVPHTLHDVRLGVVTVPALRPLKLKDDEPEQISQFLDGQHRELTDKTEPLTALENARVQMRLARFFMRHRLRDAAYLSADNVKHGLAQLSVKQPGEKETLKELSMELARLETELRVTLPYR